MTKNTLHESASSPQRANPIAFGYVTNGFLGHRLDDIIAILAHYGYNGIAISLDVHHANPFEWDTAHYRQLGRLLNEKKMRVVLETGARYLLDPYRKHYPTLVSPDQRERRIAFLKQTIDLATVIPAEAVTFFTGRPEPTTAPDEAWRWVINGCAEVCRYAEEQGVTLALEPEPEMTVETIADFLRVRQAVDSPALGVTVDICHLHCSEPDSIGEAIKRAGSYIRNIHLSDARNRVHDHLLPGDGVVDFTEAFQALIEQQYTGLVNLELSRHSHDAPGAAQRSLAYLREALARVQHSATLAV
jgi:sugar phosphate isomerase/epimerase